MKELRINIFIVSITKLEIHINFIYYLKQTAKTIGRDFVWQAVEQHWGNVKDVGSLKTHLLRTPELRLV